MRSMRLALAVMTLFVANSKAGTQDQLAMYREQIDSLDRRIVELLQERAGVVEKVGNIKREANLPVTVPGREQQVIEKAKNLPRAVRCRQKRLAASIRRW